jgi:ABC-type antimicrobial peptide transport system permease subunit
MNPKTKKLSIIFSLIIGTFLSSPKAHADVIFTSSIIPGAPSYVDLLIVAGVVVVIVAVVAWLIIRVIRKRNVTRK